MCIVLFLVTCAVNGFPYKHINVVRFKQFVPYLLLFVLITIYCTVLDKSVDAKFYFEKSLSLLVFPLAFMLLPRQFSARQKNSFYLLFSFAAIGLCLYGISQVVMLMHKHVGVNKFWPTWGHMLGDNSLPHLLRSNFEQITAMHPTYASLLLGVAFIAMLQVLLASPPKPLYQKVCSIIAMVVILFIQAIIAARTPFVATLISGIIFFTFKKQSKKAIVLVITSFVIVSLGFTLLSPLMLNRFKEVNEANLNMPSATMQNSFNIRTGIYHCAILIIKQHWLLGVGPGRLQAELNHCYYTISTDVYMNKNYNTHNQFLDYWCAMGIAAPLLLIAIFLIHIKRNYLYKSLMPISFAVLFFICMLTENILLRHTGIVSFTLLMALNCYQEGETIKN